MHLGAHSGVPAAIWLVGACAVSVQQCNEVLWVDWAASAWSAKALALQKAVVAHILSLHCCSPALCLLLHCIIVIVLTVSRS